VVYNVKGRDIPIVHRVIKQHASTSKGIDKQYLLTKGDKNPTDDIELYVRGQTYLDPQEEIIGLVEGFVPYVGMVTIWMNEIKWIKYSVIGGLGLLAILQREG
jgi:signal peptidase I